MFYKIQSFFYFLLTTFFAYASEDIKLSTTLSSREVYAGGSIRLNIKINGSDYAEAEELKIDGCKIEFLGGRNTSSRQIIITDRVREISSKSYELEYEIIPLKEGEYTIPSINIKTQGKILKTPILKFTALKPQESTDILLSVKVSKSEAWIGEEIKGSVTWYIGKDVRGFNFNLPIFNASNDFLVIPCMPKIQTQNQYKLKIDSYEFIAKKGTSRIGGKDYLTLSFDFFIIPKKAGFYQFPPASVTCDVLVGYKKVRDPFSSFFDDSFVMKFFEEDDFFFQRREGIYERRIAYSENITLNIKSLPQKDIPTNFAGHVGKYSLEVTAEPKEVNVGDPITLTIYVKGPESLEYIKFPSLTQQEALIRDFKIHEEMADGVVQDNTKVFRQTIRARHDKITLIPSIELPYFDPEDGKYKIARSTPIPIKVNPTRLITIPDAVGSAVKIEGKLIEDTTEGISHNYEGEFLLKNRPIDLTMWFTLPIGIIPLFAPPSIFIIALLTNLIVSNLYRNNKYLKRRKALKEALKNIKKAEKENMISSNVALEILRTYFGVKLSLPENSLTSVDIKKALKEKNIPDEQSHNIISIFEMCENTLYSGQGTTAVNTKILKKSLKELDHLL